MLDGLREWLHDWRDRRTAFRELRRQKAEDAPYEGEDQKRLLSRMATAAFQGNPEAALVAWYELRMRAPALAITSSTAMRALMFVGHHDVVEQALTEALQKYPGSDELALLYAEAAQHQGRNDVAAERWESVRRRFPHMPQGYIFGSEVLNHLGRHEEADKLLAHWNKVDPRDSSGSSRYARTAELVGNWQAALERWRGFREHIYEVDGWIGESRALLHLGREPEAIEVLEEARWRFQSTSRPMIELTEIAASHCSQEESLALWARVRDHFPADPRAHITPAFILRDLGRREEADELLARFIERDLRDSGVAVTYASFAPEGDAQEANRRWAIVREIYPEREEGYSGGAAALEAMGEFEQAAAVRATKR